MVSSTGRRRRLQPLHSCNSDESDETQRPQYETLGCRRCSGQDNADIYVDDAGRLLSQVQHVANKAVFVIVVVIVVRRLGCEQLGIGYGRGRQGRRILFMAMMVEGTHDYVDRHVYDQSATGHQRITEKAFHAAIIL